MKYCYLTEKELPVGWCSKKCKGCQYNIDCVDFQPEKLRHIAGLLGTNYFKEGWIKDKIL